VRFTKAAKVPMTPGVSVDLIPVFISDKSAPTIADKPLKIGAYARLTETGIIGNLDEGCCIFLLVLSR
jgi:hypothetical protein